MIEMAGYGYGSIPIRYIFSGMNIHLPAILGFTRYQGFDPSPYVWILFLLLKNHKDPVAFLRQVPTDKARAFAFDIDWDAVHVPRDVSSAGVDGWGI